MVKTAVSESSPTLSSEEDLKETLDAAPKQSPYLAGAAYCTMSASMVLLNKYALSGFEFHGPNTLLFAQCLASVLTVKAGEILGVWTVEPLRWEIVKIWAPVNVIFVLMLASGVWALQALGVAMVTILKNLTNLLTITGDYVFFGRTYNAYVWLSLFLITAAALVGASTDAAFSTWGYAAQLLNCAFTAAYSLVLRGVMDKVTAKLGRKMETHNEVFLNNLLSLPLVAILALAFGEPSLLRSDAALQAPAFYAVALLSCGLGFFISYAALWFLSTTTPTAFSLVGSLNKIPVAVIGIVLFQAPTTPANLASIAVGLLAGVLFSRAKQRS